MSTLGYSKTPELPITMEATPEEDEVFNHMSVTDTLTERGKRYGKFKDHAKITQELKRAIFRHMDLVSKVEPDADQLEALEMICHKIGRIVNGDPDYADSWHDIAGYAQLVADRLNGVER